MVAFVSHGHGDTRGMAGGDRLSEGKGLAQGDGDWPGRLRTEYGRNQRTAPHTVTDHAMKQRLVGIGRIQMRRVGIA